MQIKYLTTPQPQYVTRNKTAGMVYARTNITCPLCKELMSNRKFDEHVNTRHGVRKDECYAMLYGAPWPARCTCGKDLHYSSIHKGFPTSCGICEMGVSNKISYKNAEDAHKHALQLKAQWDYALAEEKRLVKEAELSRIPLDKLPFPTKKDFRFLKRLSISIRTYTVGCEKDKLFELANVIDNMLKELE